MNGQPEAWLPKLADAVLAFATAEGLEDNAHRPNTDASAFT
jgi:hypothetical protein